MTKWFHYNKNGINSEVSFEPWGKVESQENGNCIYFDLQKKSYHETKCTGYYCGMCEIEQKRAVFRIQSECDDVWETLRVSSHYFFSQHSPGGFTFSETNGETKFIENIGWSLFHIYYNSTKKTLAALEKYGLYDLMGLNKWNVNNCGNKLTALLKLNNVSIL
jgi:hypothetical protein